MPLIETASLIDQPLDYMVAKCLNFNVVVLTVEEQRARWMEQVPAENREKEQADWETYLAATAKPKLYILAEDGYKRTPHHDEAKMAFNAGIPRFEFSTSWLQAGPIIDSEDIQWCRLNGQIEAWTGFDYIEWRTNWDSEARMPAGAGFGTGPTILIAAMRCFVASKLGETVDVPSELLV